MQFIPHEIRMHIPGTDLGSAFQGIRHDDILSSGSNLFLCQSPLNAFPNLLLMLCHLLFPGIITHQTGLIERILLTLLKLFPRYILPLLLP